METLMFILSVVSLMAIIRGERKREKVIEDLKQEFVGKFTETIIKHGQNLN